ncbi:MAG: hypothetical protein R3A80_12695 [Bdellovibrionota bacterium]
MMRTLASKCAVSQSLVWEWKFWMRRYSNTAGVNDLFDPSFGEFIEWSVVIGQ